MDDLYYGDAGLNKRMFSAYATLSVPVIWSTAAGTGGPLLWNGSSTVNARIVKVGISVTTASSVAASIGLTGAAGQTAAPSSTTAIDGTGNCFVGGPKSAVTPYRIGTVTNAGTFFIPIMQVTGAALSATALLWADVNRLIVVPPGGWVSLAASSTMTSAVVVAGIIWEEIPV